MDLRDFVTIYTKDCKQLDKNGQAFIYIHPTTQQQLVLKPQDNTNRFDDPLNLLMQEFRKMVLLSAEPEIATVYHLVKVNDDKIGYLMEYIKGQSLQNYLSNNSVITYQFAFNVIISVISGIEKAHHYGVTHDDLHAGNIMIDDRGFCKLIDFIDWNVTQFKNDDIGVENDFAFIGEIFIKFFLQLSDKNDQRKILALQTIFQLLIKENSINGLTNIIKNTNKSIETIFFYDPLMLRILPLFFETVTIDDVKSRLMTIKTFTTKIAYNDSYNNELGKHILKNDIQTNLTLCINFLISIGLVAQYKIANIKYQDEIAEFSILFTVTPSFFALHTLVSKYHILDIYRTREDLSRNLIEFAFALHQNVHNLGKECALGINK